jgi:hypothetical protein
MVQLSQALIAPVEGRPAAAPIIPNQKREASKPTFSTPSTQDGPKTIPGKTACLSVRLSSDIL